MRDLRVHAQPCGGTLHHWRDNNGHEIDVIVTLADDRWGAFEVKLGPADADTAAAPLHRFTKKIDTSRIGAPRSSA